VRVFLLFLLYCRYLSWFWFFHPRCP
jgi:hypothetical protein